MYWSFIFALSYYTMLLFVIWAVVSAVAAFLTLGTHVLLFCSVFSDIVLCFQNKLMMMMMILTSCWWHCLCNLKEHLVCVWCRWAMQTAVRLLQRVKMPESFLPYAMCFATHLRHARLMSSFSPAVSAMSSAFSTLNPWVVSAVFS